eukprot:5116398-Amphidinium_carterae.1
MLVEVEEFTLDEEEVPATGLDEVPPPGAPATAVELIYHGSFAPAHPGHAACVIDALAVLRAHDTPVRSLHLGLTDEAHASDKPDGEHWAHSEHRAKLLQSVLQDEETLDLTNIRIHTNACS